MNTIYLEPEIYDKIEAVETFPNPDVKIGLFGNEKCRLQKTCLVKVEDLSSERTAWFTNITDSADNQFVMVDCENGFFPTDLVCGVINGKYDPNTELAKQSGYVESNSSSGSASQIFHRRKFYEKGGGKDILKYNGFFFKENLN